MRTDSQVVGDSIWPHHLQYQGCSEPRRWLLVWWLFIVTNGVTESFSWMPSAHPACKAGLELCSREAKKVGFRKRFFIQREAGH